MARGNVVKASREKTPGILDPIEVFCRVRPLAGNDESCVQILSDTVLEIANGRSQKFSQNRIEEVVHRCTFNKIFSEDVTQKDMFEHVGLPLVQDLLLGKNALCFMYGITGSGKTYSMKGKPSDGGLLPRSLECIFNSVKHLQTPRGLLKTDCYNGFTIAGEEDGKNDAKVKFSEINNILKKLDKNDSSSGSYSDAVTLPFEENINCAIFISFVEIYNNSVFDLLENIDIDELGQPKPPGSKILREDRRGCIFVYEASEIEVKSSEEAFALFRLGHHKRRTAHTMLNTESSRSHCVFTIKMVQVPLGPNGDQIVKDVNLIGISQLSLCDLAGSERANRTKTEGEKTKQAGHINNSLMTLRTCIEVLRENQKNHTGKNKMVPYRDSKLTHLFRNYFDGDGRLNMIICLNPKVNDFDESLHVLKFAEMTQEVKVVRSDGLKYDHGPSQGLGSIGDQPLSSITTSDDNGSLACAYEPLLQFPAWPILELTGYDDSTTLPNLLYFLEERNQSRQELLSVWKVKVKEVRQMILQLQQDNVDLTRALEEHSVQLSEKDKEQKSYEKKIKALNENLLQSTRSFESEKRELQVQLDEHKELVNEERQKRLKLKRALKDLTSTERLKWERECEKRVIAKQQEMEGKVMVSDEKLKQLQLVVQDLKLPEKKLPEVQPNQNTSDEAKENVHVGSCEHTVEKCKSSEHKTRTKKRPKKHEENVPSDQGAYKTPDSKKLKKAPTPNVHVSTTPGRYKNVRSKSPPAVLSQKKNEIPLRGRHRRSQSVDFWLNHKPAETLSTNNLMQPVLKNKKTVSSPKVKDLKFIPNYILTHQEEDSAGEIETQLIKGEVRETRGGGSCVQFTEIETLKHTLKGKITSNTTERASEATRPVEQANPKNTKKYKSGSKSTPKKRKSIDDVTSSEHTDVETRCCTGIESSKGHIPGIKYNKRLKS